MCAEDVAENCGHARYCVSRRVRTFHFAFETIRVAHGGGAENGVLLSRTPGADAMLRLRINWGGRLDDNGRT